jgi:two-component system NtrC family response regulator
MSVTERTKLLIVEDDDGLRRQYRWALADYELLMAGSREEGLALFGPNRPPVVILDLGLPPDPDGASEGLETLGSILKRAPETKVIGASGNESRENALRAVSLGAYDFYQKPVQLEELQLIVGRALRLYQLEDENRRLFADGMASPLQGLITAAPDMQRVCRSIEKIAPTSVSVMLLGESGTGKELLALAVHRLSPRSKAPFIAINCAAIPDNLLESELFGHEKGAFTGAVKQTIGKVEAANSGTLFLDEIGDLSMSLQAKLLRFLQQRVIERIGGRQQIAVDVRVVCATNQNLEKLMAEGRFREDLYFRLNEVAVRIPPLRERESDALLLLNFFLHKYNREFGRNIRGITSDAARSIAAYSWPGNVRELENKVKRAVVMSEGTLIDAKDLDLPSGDEEAVVLDLREARNRAERRVVNQALAQAGGNMSKAAKLLGVSRPTLYTLLETHQIAVPKGGVEAG